jgi:hypothetical protein
MASNWTPSDIGHTALDVLGLVPGIGEGADLANAAWLAAEGDYLGAGLSVLSMIPVVGDVLGKGGKVARAIGGQALKPVYNAIKNLDIPKALGPLRNNPKLAPHIDKMIEALEKWRGDLAKQFGDCPPGVQGCPGKIPAGPAPVRISNTNVPARILEKLTPAQREVFERAIKEVEDTPIVARPDKAVFYSGMKDGVPAWKAAEEMASKGAVDSVNSLTKNLLNRPEIRDILPDDAMGFIDDMASKKLAEGASGVLNLVGDLDTIRESSVFRRIELPALLKNANISPESRAKLVEMAKFLDAKYGK